MCVCNLISLKISLFLLTKLLITSLKSTHTSFNLVRFTQIEFLTASTYKRFASKHYAPNHSAFEQSLLSDTLDVHLLVCEVVLLNKGFATSCRMLERLFTQASILFSSMYSQSTNGCKITLYIYKSI